ncbi:MAG: hypothetical protein DI598_07635 [Pseudopedobacter saltans]|uniref:Carboxylic ester hydrolase n=1 Tax=Pseudopedobacter saltans TaxID=151895 RepID=A0A2W5H1G0_9SPHI|nr:MAG: hypothetical protein DI598_07635 [Pseudopedobacter saltans]
MQNEVSFSTRLGTIIGKKDAGLIRILGVPYAKAARYEIPNPIESFSKPFEAFSLSAAPPQVYSPVLEKVLGVDILDSLRTSEDCLQLSITMPDIAPVTSRLPVMIWIYGGSYSSGAGDASVYNPELLVQEQQVIFVSINYRLGVLGFLGGFDDRPANLGILDILEAIRWVKNNIVAFGGDADNITLFGQSAGGDAIAHLMLVDGMENLVRNVIIQSAPLGIRKNRQKMTEKMISMIKDLTSEAPLNDILKRQENINLTMPRKFALKGGMPFGVQYGYFPFPKEENIVETWRNNAKHFNILMGYTDEETSLFAPFIKPLTSLDKIPFLGKSLIKYFVKKTTDIVYRKPGNEFAKEMAENGANIYLYHVSWGAKNEFGATHTIDIPLLFGNENTFKSAKLLEGISWEKQYEDGKKLRAIWGQFAKSGSLKDENIKGLISIKKVE